MKNNNDKNDKFWINKPDILFGNNNCWNFIPTFENNTNENLNALTRLCIYFLIIVFVSNKSEYFIYGPIFFIIMTIFVYYLFNCNDNTENMTVQFDSPYSKPPKLEIQTQFFDFDGNLQDIGNNLQNNLCMSNDYSCKSGNNTYRKNERKKCSAPTCNNPMMNSSINDLQIADPPEPCNVDDSEIQNKITECFNDKLYLDIGDEFEKQNSQRQFFTIPRANPNDQKAFADWLYKYDNPRTNPGLLLPRYEDLRYKTGEMLHI